jgi:hypothetical protein
VDKADAVAALSGVQTANLDEVIPLDDPRPAGAVVPTPQTPPSASTPNNNPYMPIGDTGAKILHEDIGVGDQPHNRL